MLNLISVFLEILSLTTPQHLNGVNPSSQNVSSINVVVIGGGVSGLTAATNLHKAGFNVTLLEAMDRIGGRTHTVKLENEHHIEIGGEWVHGEKENAVFDLMYPLGLLDNTIKKDETEFVLDTGTPLNTTMTEQLSEFLNIIVKDPDSWRIKGLNYTNYGVWGEFVLNKFLKENHISWNNTQKSLALDIGQKAIIGSWSAENWWDFSKRDDGEQSIDCEGNFETVWKPPYSYSSLHEFILTGNVTRSGKFVLPDWIYLDSEVSRVESSPETSAKFIVHTEDERQYVADHVVFTPSLGVLKARHEQIFSPALPKKKQLAIQNLGFGCVEKVFLEFPQPWWPPNFSLIPLWEDHDYLHGDSHLQWWRSNITKKELLEVVDGLPLWCRGITSVAAIDSGSAPNYLRVWVSSIPAKTIDGFEQDYLQTWVMGTIRKFLSQKFPNISEPINLHKSSWWSNPFTRGTYSFRTPASDENDVWARDLADPIYQPDTNKPVICFAGEATHPIHFASVHGAYETGIREFERIKSFYTM